MPRSIGILAALLVSALAWAYWLGHPAKEAPSQGGEAVAVWRVDPRDIRRVKLQSQKTTVTIETEAMEDGGSPYLWVTWEGPTPRKRRGRGKTRDQPDTPEKTVHRFKGNQAVESALIRLADLKARRRVGELSSLDGEVYNLPGDGDVLEMELANGDTRRLELGGFTFGNTYRYGLNTGDHTVYLIRTAALQNLTRGKRRLLDSRLLGNPATEAARVELRMGENAVTLWRLTGDTAQWALKEGGAEDPALLEWINALNRLRATDYLAEDDPAPEEESAALAVRVFAGDNGEPAEWLKLFGEVGGDWHARSAHTRRMVTVNPKPAQNLLEKAGNLTAER